MWLLHKDLLLNNQSECRRCSSVVECSCSPGSALSHPPAHTHTKGRRKCVQWYHDVIRMRPAECTNAKCGEVGRRNADKTIRSNVLINYKKTCESQNLVWILDWPNRFYKDSEAILPVTITLHSGFAFRNNSIVVVFNHLNNEHQAPRSRFLTKRTRFLVK